MLQGKHSYSTVQVDQTYVKNVGTPVGPEKKPIPGCGPHTTGGYFEPNPCDPLGVGWARRHFLIRTDYRGQDQALACCQPIG